MLTQAEFEKNANEVMERLCDIRENFCELLAPDFVSCDAEKRELTLRYRVRKWQENPNGVIHGGVVAAMLDNTLSILVNSMCCTKCVTISLNTSFLRPARGGDELMVHAHMTFPGRSIVHCEGRVWIDGAPEKPIAAATGVFKP